MCHELKKNGRATNVMTLNLKTWFRPLPAEALIAAVMGSALSVTLVNEKALAAASISGATETVALLVTIVAFVIFVHLSSTAVLRRRFKTYAILIPGMLIAIGVINTSRISAFSISSDQTVQFHADGLALMVTILLLLWLLAQNAVSLIYHER
jgi:hypothetical protein